MQMGPSSRQGFTVALADCVQFANFSDLPSRAANELYLSTGIARTVVCFCVSPEVVRAGERGATFSSSGARGHQRTG